MKCIDQVVTDQYAIYNGDCVEVLQGLPDHSIDYSIFSPPFASLYTYSNSPRDMGNCKDDEVFFTHFGFLIDELYRAMKPGRIVMIHCMNLMTTKWKDGYTGMRDFRGEIIKAFCERGFIYHSEVCIWKDPVTAMQRTKAHGLLYKTLRTDSAASRQGLPDYLVIMRKPGVNPKPITHTPEDFPLDDWQEWASPVWMDIDQTDVLSYREAREVKDERHICPLQLGLIRKALRLWSAPDDLVFSPFGGIGSEGYVSLQMGRRFVGAELKRSYWSQAVATFKRLDEPPAQVSLF
jgi:DNA modification methylase